MSSAALGGIGHVSAVKAQSVHIVTGRGDNERDLTVDYRPDARVRDLADALDLQGELRIGPLVYSADELLDVVDLHHGVRVDALAGQQPSPPRPGDDHSRSELTTARRLVVEQLSGRGAGHIALLSEGSWQLSAPRETTSTIRLGLDDGEESGAPWAPGDVRRHGSSWFAIHSHERADELRWDSSRSAVRSHRVNRPPRITRPDLAATPPVPDAPPEPQKPDPPSLLTLLLPLAVGAVIAVLYRPWFLVFSLLAPAMSLGRWWDSVRGFRRSHTEWTTVLAELDVAARVRAHDEKVSALAARRAAMPTLAELASWCTSGAPRLWERRTHHDDFLVLAVGWSAIAGADPATHGWPVGVDLSGHRSVGIVGDPAVTEALARALVVQAIALHGPADLAVAVPSTPSWDWCKWLPHAAVSPDAATAALVVAAPDDLDRSESAGAAVIVLASSVTELPSWCDTIVTCAGGSSTCVEVQSGATDRTVGLLGCSAELARAAALGLAAQFDPELGPAGSPVPAPVVFEDLLESRPEAEVNHSEPSPQHRLDSLDVALGIDRNGGLPVHVDLVSSGPHALVAGTTGSGKSELLRTWVLALAARYDVGQCQFVLVDFKGGGAFDPLASLPHTAAVVTDLDPAVAERALVALRAELTARERWLRSAGLSDIGQAPDPVPSGSVAQDRPARLVLVVDEFATLASDLPGFLDGLIDIAQRGRSLGVHLVLATQRPAGVVDQKIRSNMNLRICLRVQHDSESLDIVGTPEAARFSAKVPGRAIVRADAEIQVDMQTAWVTPPRQAPGFRVRCAPFVFGDHGVDTSPSRHDVEGGPGTEVDHFAPWVGLITERFESLGLRSAIAPWLPALDPSLCFGDLPSCSDPLLVPIGRSDDPVGRQQPPWAWDLTEPLAIVGGSSAERHQTVELLLAAAHTTDRPVALVASDPAILDSRLASSAMVAPDVESLSRLFDVIESAVVPSIVIIDRYDLFAVGAEEREQSELRARLDHLLCSASSPRCALAVLAPSERSIRHQVLAQIRQKLVLTLPDPSSIAAFGLRPQQAPTCGHRAALDPRTARVVQLARVRNGERHVPRSLHVPQRPTRPRLQDLVTPATRTADDSSSIVVPIGIDVATLGVVDVTFGPGRPFVIAGRPGSGRTTTLQTLRSSLARSRPDCRVVAVGGAWGPEGAAREESRESVAFDHTGPELEVMVERALDDAHPDRCSGTAGPTVVLIDDAELLAANERLWRAVDSSDAAVVVAGTVDLFRRPRTLFHDLAARRNGLVLSNDRLDTDLFRAPALRSPGAGWVPGIGVLVDRSAVRLVQVACSQ